VRGDRSRILLAAESLLLIGNMLSRNFIKQNFKLCHAIINSTTAKCSFSTAASESYADYDIIICGNGAVGSLFLSKLLCKLNSKNDTSLKIAMVDLKQPMSLSVCVNQGKPSTRVYALSPSTISLLKDINAWDLIKDRSQRYTSMQVWDGCGAGIVQFSSEDVYESELGRIVEDDTLQVC
jgi:hypothetical protein